MRRSERSMDYDSARDALERTEWGVLSLTDGKIPYGVPLNFVYLREENSLYFHAAIDGKKLDLIRRNPAAHFIAVTEAEVLPERYSTAYRSVMAEGTVKIVTNNAEKKTALCRLCDKFVGQKDHDKIVKSWFDAVTVLRFEISELSGKFNR